ncbi:MAG TPA: carbohydrate porin [Myxococcaceae bacterium]|nr:carbohydrate porin [Myxococcaceae bacterium]
MRFVFHAGRRCSGPRRAGSLRPGAGRWTIGALVWLGGLLGSPSVKATEQPPPPAPASPEQPAPEWFNVHFMATFATQYHPAFSASYSGKNSMQPDAEAATAFVASLGLDIQLWPGADLVLNPEASGGYGLSSTLGVAAFPSGVVYRVGNPAPQVYLARLFLRQTIGFGGGQEEAPGGMNQLPRALDRNRLTLVVGRLSVEDYFDGNAYAHDPTSQFFDWALFASGAWDYPADTRGYTYGFAADLTIQWWSVRASIALEPLYANLEVMDWNIAHAHGLVAEFEARWTALGGHGAVRFTPFFNAARMGSYGQVLADPAAYGGQVQPTRAYGRTKYGFGISADQQLSAALGVFLRASWNDGANETWAFTEIDRSLAAGVVYGGSLWGWRDYEVGGALVVNGLSGLHRAYLAQGGYGFIIGDGRLSYAPEVVGDFYGRVDLMKWLQISVLYQPVFDPAYNSARGPIHVFTFRVRVAL